MGVYATGNNIQAHFQNPVDGVNKAMTTTLGTVNANGDRRITDKKEIKQFVESLKK